MKMQQKSSLRDGCFTSSEIVALLSMGSRDMTDAELEQYRKDNPKSRKRTIETWPGKAAITYINQCNMERRLGKSLDNESDAKPLGWGKFLERLLFSMLDEEYEYSSNETCVHPDFYYWVGTPDGERKGEIKAIAETKCPFTLESFCKLVDPLYEGYEGLNGINALRNGYTNKNGLLQPPHPDAEKYYWQKVSNACIKGYDYADFIIYCPYESELQVIQSAAVQSGDPNVYFIANGSKKSLPCIPDNGFYKNINVYSFRIPNEDKIFLTETIKKAEKYLISL